MKEIIVDAHNNKYLLKCWHNLVSGDAEFLQIQEFPFEKQFINRCDLITQVAIKGFFAYYPEGLFCLYKNNSDELLISWNGQEQPLNILGSISWSSELRGRHFVALDNSGKVLMDFRYQTLKRFRIKPLSLISEFFFPDDDWGLVADLPSFVHSRFVEKNLLKSFENLLQKGP